MGLFDLFRPKWKHSKSKVRLAAVEELDDQAVLVEIAKTDRDDSVGKAALKKLASQGLITDVAMGARDAYVRIAAAHALVDEEQKQSAFQGLITAMDRSEVRGPFAGEWKPVIEQIRDTDFLGTTADTHRDTAVRLAAAKRLPPQRAQKVFKDLATGTGTDRDEAVELLEDKRLLEALAVDESQPSWVRGAAARNPNLAEDQFALLRVYEACKHSYKRTNHGADDDVRRAVAARLTNRDTLRDISVHDVSGSVQREASRRLDELRSA